MPPQSSNSPHHFPEAGDEGFTSPYETGNNLTPFDTKSYGSLPVDHRRTTAYRVSNIGRNLAILTLPPWLVYSVTYITFAFLGSAYLPVAIVIAGMLVLGSILLVLWFMGQSNSDQAQGQAKGQSRQHTCLKWCGILCIVSVANGIMAGMSRNIEFFGPYSKYKNGPTYTDVLPTEPAASRSDAAIIGFTSHSVVDTFKTGSVRSVDGARLCVAPIFDESQQTRAEFWAVGFDCCQRHLGFYCGDTQDQSVHSGIVVYDTDSVFTSRVYEKYLLAVNQSTARNALEPVKSPVLVRWLKSPEEARNDFLGQGLMRLLIGVIIAFFFSAFVGAATLVLAGMYHDK